MGLDRCGVVCIYVIILSNIVLAVVGSASLGLGLWLRFNTDTNVLLLSFKSFAFVTGVTVMIVAGTFTLIAVLFGSYGCSSRKRWALQTYSALLFCLAIAPMVFGILAISMKDEVGLRTVEFYISLYALYDGKDPVIGLTLRIIHNMLHCCGVTGISLIESTCPKPSGFLEKIIMPNCPEVIARSYLSTYPFLLAVCFAYAFLLCVPISCSSKLCKLIRLSASTPQYNIITNYALTNPQPHQQGFVLTSTSYPNTDPNISPLLTVADAPEVKA
ncbi:CD9 antigen-like [Paralichthys olivaceus]|uniref:CD9 antigen-like n=1 Tax=Paralichthys olivaceus TaxID=8255 RepID=UPI00097D4FDE|nr:PREDICTED: CD9 antigen-like [Paralichthys olivaceus]XP_019966332.1 PREDICTED: CD9 antigen-like [Paralichthys olivaceus]